MKNQVIVDKSLPKNLPLLMKDRAWNYGDYICQRARNKSGKYISYTYKETYSDVLAFAIAMQEIGVKRGSHVGLIADNRREWLVTDLALLSLGAADVPRGCDTMSTEICYILDYADCLHSFFENGKQLEKLLDNADKAPNVKTAILFDAASEETLEKANLYIDFHIWNNWNSKGSNVNSQKFLGTIRSNWICSSYQGKR